MCTIYSGLTTHLRLDRDLYVARQIIDLHLVLALLLLQLLFDPLEVVDLLSQLSHAVSMFFSQSCSDGVVMKRGLLEVSSQFLELSLSLFVDLHLSDGGSACLLQPLADLFQLPGEVRPLLLHLRSGSMLHFNLLHQLFNASLNKATNNPGSVIHLWYTYS